MRKFTVTLNERQLRIIAECVEDVSRFISGQMELWNATSQYLQEHHELHAELAKLQPLVTPDLQRGSSHKWNGVSCENKAQGQFIAESYYIYHEIMHQLLKDKVSADNVYYSPTLRCENSGDPIVIEEVKETLVFDREYSERIIKQCEEEMQNPIISEKDRQRCEWVIAFHKHAIKWWHERKDKNMEYMDGDRWDDKKTCSRKTNRVI